jgi:hypothetical protein
MREIEIEDLFDKETMDSDNFSAWEAIVRSDINLAFLESGVFDEDVLRNIEYLIRPYGLEFVLIDDGSEYWIVCVMKEEEHELEKIHIQGMNIPKIKKKQ